MRVEVIIDAPSVVLRLDAVVLPNQDVGLQVDDLVVGAAAGTARDAAGGEASKERDRPATRSVWFGLGRNPCRVVFSHVTFVEDPNTWPPKDPQNMKRIAW